jgi:hypothetical protein
MIVYREIEPKTYDISYNHGWVTQSESFEAFSKNNPTDFFSVSDLLVYRGLSPALQEVKEEGYRSVNTIIIKINKFGSGFNQIEGIITIQLFLLR